MAYLIKNGLVIGNNTSTPIDWSDCVLLLESGDSGTIDDASIVQKLVDNVIHKVLHDGYTMEQSRNDGTSLVFSSIMRELDEESGSFRYYYHGVIITISGTTATWEYSKIEVQTGGGGGSSVVPDNTSISYNANEQLQVKNGGITEIKLNEGLNSTLQRIPDVWVDEFFDTQTTFHDTPLLSTIGADFEYAYFHRLYELFNASNGALEFPWTGDSICRVVKVNDVLSDATDVDDFVIANINDGSRKVYISVVSGTILAQYSTVISAQDLINTLGGVKQVEFLASLPAVEEPGVLYFTEEE